MFGRKRRRLRELEERVEELEAAIAAGPTVSWSAEYGWPWRYMPSKPEIPMAATGAELWLDHVADTSHYDGDKDVYRTGQYL